MKLINGDCLEELKNMDSNSIDSIVTDPPYGISFMSKKWDYDIPSVEIWKECLRVLKPGGHALIACGTRTQHRMVVNIEDAGFEIRDVITWLYGSGFPKSYNISKAIDKKFGAEREVVGISENDRPNSQVKGGRAFDKAFNKGQEHETIKVTKPSTDQAKQWDGWGTALKPACEFFTLCRKPLSEKNIVDNVLRHGTGGINIDESRVENGQKANGSGHASTFVAHNKTDYNFDLTKGRFPANLILDEEAGKMLDEQSGLCKTGALTGQPRVENKIYGSAANTLGKPRYYKPDAATGASRFFYCAKSSKSERNRGLEGMEEKPKYNEDNRFGCHEIFSKTNKRLNPKTGKLEARKEYEGKTKNHHPTVKPIKLMEYLIKLITPTNGIVLDCFMGSGSTGVAARNLGFNFTGIELNKDYFEIAERRILHAEESCKISQ